MKNPRKMIVVSSIGSVIGLTVNIISLLFIQKWATHRTVIAAQVLGYGSYILGVSMSWLVRAVQERRQ